MRKYALWGYPRNNPHPVPGFVRHFWTRAGAVQWSWTHGYTPIAISRDRQP